MADWAESRKEFVGKHLSILSLGAEYYYDEKQDNTHDDHAGCVPVCVLMLRFEIRR